jgi:hypothetical protein
MSDGNDAQIPSKTTQKVGWWWNRTFLRYYLLIQVPDTTLG